MRLFCTTHLPSSPSTARWWQAVTVSSRNVRRDKDVNNVSAGSQRTGAHAHRLRLAIQPPDRPCRLRCHDTTLLSCVCQRHHDSSHGMQQTQAKATDAGKGDTPNGDVPMDIVSAASLTKPASTNHTPGSRADPGSEICRCKAQQCWLPATISSHTQVTAAEVTAGRGASPLPACYATLATQRLAGRLACWRPRHLLQLLAPANPSTHMFSSWHVCRHPALPHDRCHMFAHVPPTWRCCLPMPQAGKPLGLFNTAGTWQLLCQTL
jgi:hypothetical protein